MQDLLLLYRSKLRQLDRQQQQQQQQPAGLRPGTSSSVAGGGSSASASAGSSSSTSGPDLMSIRCRRLQGVAVLCVGSPEAAAAARQQIAAVDPPSAGIEMAKVPSCCRVRASTLVACMHAWSLVECPA